MDSYFQKFQIKLVNTSIYFGLLIHHLVYIISPLAHVDFNILNLTSLKWNLIGTPFCSMYKVAISNIFPKQSLS